MNLDKRTLEYAEKYLYYKNNPVDFIKDCIYLPAPGKDILFDPYPPQKKLIETIYEKHHVIILKSRQIGISTLSQAILVHMMIFWDNMTAGIISRLGSEASSFARHTSAMIDKLPQWIKPKFSSRNVQNFILDNNSQLWSTAVSITNPSSSGRGRSFNFLILDEAAYILHADEVWTGLAPALFKSQNVAKQNNIPYGTLMISTPSNKQPGTTGYFFFQQWQRAINPDSIFRPFKIHWKEIPEFANDPEWYPRQCALLGNDQRKIQSELELRFISSENTLFTEQVQTDLQKMEGKKPLEIIKFHGEGEMWKFENLDKNKFFLLGVDTASETGSDFSTVEVFDYITMNQIMEFKGKLSVTKFSEIVKLIAKMVPHNIIIVENNSYGNQVVESLRFDENYTFNIFGEMKGKSPNQTFVPGLNTNSKTRPLILDALFHYINDDPGIIKSERLALELLTLTDKKGRIEAESGLNDDLCLSFGFICYARRYATNLIGDTEPLGEGEVVNNDETINMIHNFNEPDIPLLGDFENQDFQQFKKSLDKFVQNGVNNGTIQGQLNIFDLWRKSE